MRVHSYVVDHDIGFAPNPFHGFCTLATCKPMIRKGAEVGDWVIGTGAAKNRRQGYLVYAMRVSEIITFDEYWADDRFARKRPNLSGSRMLRFGDNIYHRAASGEWLQENSRHSGADGSPEALHVATDTGTTERVLISEDYVYYGAVGPQVPLDLRTYELDLVSLRGHRNRFSERQVGLITAWLDSLPRGVEGTPFDWHRERNLRENRERTA